MKKYIIGIIILAVLGFATYSIQQQFGVGNFNLASVLNSTATSTSPSNCQSPYLVQQLQSEVDTLNTKIKGLGTQLTTVSKQLVTAKTNLTRAKTAEATALKAYTAAQTTYPPKLAAAERKIIDLNTKVQTASKSTTKAQLAGLQKQLTTARADYAKLNSAYNAIIAKYKAAENTRKQLESQVGTLTATEGRLKSGAEKAELTAQLAILTNGTTGTLTLMKKKPACPAAETKGKSIYDSMCRDSIDNDGNGKTDCDDSACSKDKYCAKVTPTKPTTPSVPTIPTQPTSGCSIGGYTDKASCENATIWVSGSCSDSSYASQSDCEANGGTYTPGSDQPAGGEWKEPEDGGGEDDVPYMQPDACEELAGVARNTYKDDYDGRKAFYAIAKVNVPPLCNLPICQNSAWCVTPSNELDETPQCDALIAEYKQHVDVVRQLLAFISKYASDPNNASQVQVAREQMATANLNVTEQGEVIRKAGCSLSGVGY